MQKMSKQIDAVITAKGVIIINIHFIVIFLLYNYMIYIIIISLLF